MQLDKEDTQRSSLKNTYLNVPIVLKYPYSFICFYCVQARGNAFRASSMVQ